MSIVSLNFMWRIAFLLIFICFCIETSKAQPVDIKAKKGENDSLEGYSSSLKKSPFFKWSALKKNTTLKIKHETGSVAKDISDVSPVAKPQKKNKTPLKINKHTDKKKDESDLGFFTDTTKKKNENRDPLTDEVKEKIPKKIGPLSTIIPDTMGNDTLKNKLAEKFSKEKIKQTIQGPLPVSDYNKDPKRILPNKREQSVFLKNKKDAMDGRVGLNEKKNSVKAMKDSLKHTNISEKLIKQFRENSKGSVSLGYDYGILPYATADTYPLGAFKSEGRISVMMLNLPVEVTYRYTTVKSVIGINNYFRISYDVNRYKEEFDKKMAIKDQLKKIQLDKLQLDKQDIAMKMDYLKLMSSIDIPPFSLPDTTLNTTGKFPSVPDTTRVLSYLKDKADYTKRRDSILKLTNDCKLKYEKYQAKYDSLSEMIEKINNGIGDIKSGMNHIKQFDPKEKVGYGSKAKIQEVLKNIKKFEIGLCSPSYSLFLISNAPLKGVNFEYATVDHFFAITYGTTINTLFNNPNTIQGKIQNVKNLYTFFDFNNLSTGRKVFAIKGGAGQKEATHLFVGALIGKGKIDYLSTTDPKYGKKESNVVVEIDGKYKFSETLSGELVFGKSSLQAEDLSIEQIKSSLKEICSSYRSNAAQARINYDILKTKTKIQLTGRIIDPYFKSFGVSFLRSDNIRYEIKADQVITKSIRYTISYRKEEDNLLDLINYKNTFTTINNSLNIKIKKGINIRLNYAPLVRVLKNGDQVLKDKNSIVTGILSYVPKIKDVQANFNILYSKYRITSDSGNIHFDNISYSHQFQFHNGFKTGLTASWFENTLTDTINNNTYLSVADIGYTTEQQNSLTIGGKVAYKHNMPTEYGFIFKATLKVYKSVFWETEAEKILTGDYYDGLIAAKIRKFPYYLSSKMIINF